LDFLKEHVDDLPGLEIMKIVFDLNTTFSNMIRSLKNSSSKKNEKQSMILELNKRAPSISVKAMRLISSPSLF